jgi:hypothetical protein
MPPPYWLAQNVVAERITNLGPETDHSEVFVAFSVTPCECRDSILNLGHGSFLPNPIHHSRVTLSFDAIFLITEKAS